MRRQPFSVSPSDSTCELEPATAKMAMPKSGPITTPVSLTSRNGESASLAEDAVSGRRSVGLNSGSASFRISGAAGLISAGGNWAPGEGRWLVMEPNSIRISPAQTTHPMRIKAGKPVSDFNTISVCESKDFIDAANRGKVPKEEPSVVLKASKILVSPGASVNLTPATGRERSGYRRHERWGTWVPAFAGTAAQAVFHPEGSAPAGVELAMTPSCCHCERSEAISSIRCEWRGRRRRGRLP
jgi:hypothetical protein